MCLCLSVELEPNGKNNRVLSISGDRNWIFGWYCNCLYDYCIYMDASRIVHCFATKPLFWFFWKFFVHWLNTFFQFYSIRLCAHESALYDECNLSKAYQQHFFSLFMRDIFHWYLHHSFQPVWTNNKMIWN